MDSTPEVTAGRATVGAGQLHTPQEQIHDSFSKGDEHIESVAKLAPIATLSPPTSPSFESALANFTLSTSRPQPDPPLYPESVLSEQEAPLFESQSQETEATLTESQPRTLPPLLVRIPNTAVEIEPTREAALKYYMDTMASNERMRAAQRAAGTLPFPQRSAAYQLRDPETTRQLGLLTRSAGVTKVRSPQKSAVKPRLPKATNAAQSTPSPEATPEPSISRGRRSHTPKQRQKKDLDFYNDAFPADNDKKHKRAAPSKHTAPKEDDLKWRTMQDFAPPADTLDNTLTKLWAEWHQTNTSLKVEDEPDFEELHPQEVSVCETLRLRPAQYMANKRRIFEAKVKSLQDGKQFTRTAAQNVTNIDVNKASQLWKAFERVGWFERKWFEKWLPQEEVKV